MVWPRNGADQVNCWIPAVDCGTPTELALSPIIFVHRLEKSPHTGYNPQDVQLLLTSLICKLSAYTVRSLMLFLDTFLKLTTTWTGASQNSSHFFTLCYVLSQPAWLAG